MSQSLQILNQIIEPSLICGTCSPVCKKIAENLVLDVHRKQKEISKPVSLFNWPREYSDDDVTRVHLDR